MFWRDHRRIGSRVLSCPLSCPSYYHGSVLLRPSLTRRWGSKPDRRRCIRQVFPMAIESTSRSTPGIGMRFGYSLREHPTARKTIRLYYESMSSHQEGGERLAAFSTSSKECFVLLEIAPRLRADCGQGTYTLFYARQAVRVSLSTRIIRPSPASNEKLRRRGRFSFRPSSARSQPRRRPTPVDTFILAHR